ncbi:MAG: FtsX-like permease family protein [Lachnospiraceae bacterium]|nr:FtsX-like permease family protein [Lachnospiraceae bacterium]
MKNNTVLCLALSKLRYNRSRTLLTGIAIMLTTMLLMAIGTVGIAVFDMNRQMFSEMDYHATFTGLTADQVNVLSKHINVEAMSTSEIFADIVNGKMNGVLSYRETVKDGRITDGDDSSDSRELASGHYPEAENEICSSPIFFRRVGAEPVIGGKVTLSFRVNGKGEILTEEFTISGLEPDVEISGEIDDSRLMWAAHVSRALLEKYRADGLYEPSLYATLRVYGEDELAFDEMADRINAVAADIGLDEASVNINRQYLYTVTDPGTEIMVVVAAISLIVILFSALVIYSIYYVGVITDVQEIGKLKALGASGRQIAKLFYWQGAIVSVFAVPVGLLMGFLLPYFLFPLALYAYQNGSAISSYSRDAVEAVIGQIHMFSLPVLLAAVVAALVTVAISLQKPIRLAKKVSPVEAIRYQENSADRKNRKGHHEVKVSTLTLANLTRNKRRTAVTLLTMGLSCVLFICVSAVLSSVSAEDLARRNIPKGDFRISLKYSQHDVEYPENNLDSLVQQAYFNEAFLAELSAIDGVESVERAPGKILSSTDITSAMYEDYYNRLPLSYFTRDDLAELNANLEQGSIDYDRMTANNEIVCTHVYSFEQYGLSLGDTFPLTLHDGSREIPLTVTLTALTQPDSDFSLLIMTEDTWNSLGLACDPTTDIYLYADDKHYDSVKEALLELVAENEHFILYSMDVEMRIGRSSLGLTKNPLYLLLILISVIGFINLINTMITSIVTRRKELGILQALGLSDRQLARMLSGEGLVFTAGTLLISVTLGNLFGYLLFLWAKEQHFMSISRYHYPVWETVGLALVLLIGQTIIALFINRKVKNESLIDRIRNEE